MVAEAGLDKIICFSGNRNGLDDEEGIENCAKGIERLMRTSEQHNITICMELLNSKVDHPDYQCDHTLWGVTLCDRIGSDNFKLLYDIYHMQIMEGDVIRTIRDYHEYIAHYHTGGVPGRHELDETQELYYPAIMEAIVETGIPPEHEVIVPFTRMLAGPLDFHQGSFRGVSIDQFEQKGIAPNVMGTLSRTLATYIVFQNHLPMVADYPAAYRRHPEALAILQKIPVSWDDTKFWMDL